MLLELQELCVVNWSGVRQGAGDMVILEVPQVPSSTASDSTALRDPGDSDYHGDRQNWQDGCAVG